MRRKIDSLSQKSSDQNDNDTDDKVTEGKPCCQIAGFLETCRDAGVDESSPALACGKSPICIKMKKSFKGGKTHIVFKTSRGGEPGSAQIITTPPLFRDILSKRFIHTEENRWQKDFCL
jgi:hypothetical protein